MNRTSKRVNAGTPVEYCYDHADRLTSASDPLEPVSVAAGTLAYDSHGNTSRLGDEVHTYDVAGRHVRTGPAPGASGVPTVAYVRDASNGIVSRSVDGVVSGRYGSTVAGAPSVVLNASNQPISATVGLLGGVSHSYDPTVAAVNGSWHHPNLTGHRVAVTNTSGAKVGSTTVYDPDGMLVAGVLPDDKPGSWRWIVNIASYVLVSTATVLVIAPLIWMLATGRTKPPLESRYRRWNSHLLGSRAAGCFVDRYHRGIKLSLGDRVSFGGSRGVGPASGLLGSEGEVTTG